MKRFKNGFLFAFFLLGITLLFQNCGEMKGIANGQQNRASGDNQNSEQPPVPEFLVSREISFDNKIVSNQLIQTSWSVGSTDVFYYETDYRATYESTLVTITGENSVPILRVQMDTCENQRNLTSQEAQTLSSFYEDYFGATDIRMRGAEEAPVAPGCAFPRLALDATGQVIDENGNPIGDAVDLDLYFSTPECTPNNEFMVSDRGGNDPAMARAEVQQFFRAQIDQLCPRE